MYDEKPPEEPSNNNVIIEQPKQESPALDPNDPYPQYMTKEETVDVLERWWKRRNGVDINIF